MACQNCGRRNCSPCSRCNDVPDTIVDRDIIRDRGGFGVTVNGDYTADPDDEVIQVISPVGTTPLPIITLADPDDVDQYAKITIVAQFVAVTVSNLNGDGTGTSTVAAGTASTYYVVSSGDPCATTGAVWLPLVAPT